MAYPSPRRLQLRRGNAAAIASYLGYAGELVVDTSAWTLYVHDGVTVGGYAATVNTATLTTQITSVNANITIANVGMKGYVDQGNSIQAAAITSSNVGMRGYVDATIAANIANIAVASTYSNVNVRTYLGAFDGNIIPSANVTYSLGSPTRQWKDLYVSNNTIYLGGTPLSSTPGGLTFAGVPVSSFAPTSATTVTPGTVWNFANTGRATNQLFQPSYGAGKFIVVETGNYGGVPWPNIGLYSSDGATWSTMYMPNVAQIVGPTIYGGDKFVSIYSTTGNTATSTDGINWTFNQNVIPPYGVYGYDFYRGLLAYGNGRFVALTGYITRRSVISTDGITWSNGAMSLGSVGDLPATDGQGYSLLYQSLAFTDGVFVASATRFNGTGGNLIAYSADGVSWGSMQLPWGHDLTSGYILGAGGGVFVGVPNASGRVGIRSVNGGRTWSNISLPDVYNYTSVVYGGGAFILTPAAADADVALSTDGGTTWANVATPYNSYVGGGAYGAGTFIAAGFLYANVLNISYSNSVGTLTLAPTLPGTIDRVDIGVSTPGSGSFTVLSADSISTSGDISTTGNISTTGDISAGNVSLSDARGNTTVIIDSYTGNISAGNVDVYTVTTDKIDTSNITTPGGNLTISSPTIVTGNVTANYFVGNGSQLSALPGYAYSNVNVAAYVTTSNSAIVGYIDQANTIQSQQIAAANVGMKGYVDSQTYSNINVSTYLASHIDQTIGGNLTIQGNLTVNGNVTYISVNNLVIGDNIINLADLNPADSLDLGFAAHRTPSGQPMQHTGLIRDASANQWRLFSNVVPAPGTTVDFTDAVYDDLQLGNIVIAGKSLNWANASIDQTSSLDLSITGDGQVSIRSLDGTYQWTFGYNGTTQFPNNTIDAGTNKIDLKSSDYAELWYHAVDGAWQSNPNVNQDAYLFVQNNGVGIQNVRGADGNGSPTWNHTWTFGTDGGLTLPGAAAGETIAISNGYITVGNLLIGQGGALFNSNNDSWALYGNLSDSGTTIFIPSNADADNGLALYIESQQSNVEIRSGSGTWTFGQDGNLTLSGNTFSVNYANGTPVTFSSSSYSNVQVASYLTTATINTTGNITAGNLFTSGALYVANITTTGASGNISGANYITANYFVGNGALLTGLSSSYSNVQVATYLPTYDGVVTAGNVAVNGNVTAQYFLGNGAFLTGIVGGAGNYGNIDVKAFLATGDGVSRLIQGYYANLDLGATARLYSYGSSAASFFGHDGFANVNINYVRAGQGDIQIATNNGDHNWTFSNAGNLTLPAGGRILESTYLSADSIILKPNGGTSTQYLEIAPTAVDGNHVHLMTGSGTELFLGDDNHYVKLANTGGVVINSNDGIGNTAQWTFGKTGTTQFPGSKILAPAGESITMWSDNYSQLMWENANLTVAPNMAINSNFYVTDNNATLDIGYRDGSSTQIIKSWYWNADGNLKLPSGGYILNSDDSIYGGGDYSNVQVATYLPTYSGNIGGNVSIGGTLRIRSANSQPFTPNDALYVDGGVTAGGNISSGGRIVACSFAISTSINSGAIQTNGGIGAWGNIYAGQNIVATGNITAQNLIGNITFPDSTVQTTAWTGSAPEIDITDTNGLTTIYYPTFVENRTTGQTARADVDFTYRTDDNILGVGNIAIGATGNIKFADGTVQTTAYTGGGSSYSNVQVATYLPTYAGTVSASLVNTSGNILSTGLSVFGNTRIGSLATPGALHTIIGNVDVSGAGTEYFNIGGNIMAIQASFGSINTTGNITAANFVGNISITGNVTGTSANVTLQAGAYTSVFDNQGNVRLPTAYVTGNVTANYFVGNGALLTGIVAGSNYSNVEVATYLQSGNIANVSVAGNVTATYFVGNGALLTGIVAGGSSYSNVQVATYLPTYSGNIANIRLGVSGVLTFADGTTQTTAGGGSYSNVQVATYLPTYTGNISADIITANTKISIGSAVSSLGFHLRNNGAGNQAKFETTSNQNNLQVVSTSGTVALGTWNNTGRGYVGTPNAENFSLMSNNSERVLLDINGNVGIGNTSPRHRLSVTGNAFISGNITTGNISTGSILITNNNLYGQALIISKSAGDNVRVVGIEGDASYTGAGGGQFRMTGKTDPEKRLEIGINTTANVAFIQSYRNGSGEVSLVINPEGNDVTIGSNAIPSSLRVTGNVTAPYFIGNGALLTGIVAGATSIQNGNSNVRAYSSSDIAVSVGGTANIARFTTDGITMLTGSEIRGHNIRATNGLLTSTINATSGSNISLSSIYNFNNVNNIWASNVIASGNVTATYFIGDGSQLTGLSSSYSNVQVATYLPTYTGTTGITAVGTLATLSVTGNTTVGNLVGTEANTRIIANVYTTTFDIYGNVSFPGNITTSSSGYFMGNALGTTAAYTGNVTVGGNLTIIGTKSNVPVKTGGFVAQNTAVSIDSITAQWLNTGAASANQLQLAALNGNVSILYTYTFQDGTGGSTTGGSSSTTLANLSFGWTSIGNPSGVAGDMYNVLVTLPGTNAYRITAMTGSGYSDNVLTVERLI